MTDDELNKRIHELLEMCRHEWAYAGESWYQRPCKKCGEKRKNALSVDFTSWRGFGVLWEWWQKFQQHDLWYTFRSYLWNTVIGCCKTADEITDVDGIPIKFISPRTLAEATVEFFEER